MLGPVVDVAIGLMFVYLLLGLITTAVQEAIAQFTQKRANGLYQALVGLLADGDETNQFFKTVFGHALIRGTAASDRPSYIPSRNFALAVIDVLNDNSQLPGFFSQVENSHNEMPDCYVKDSLKVFSSNTPLAIFEAWSKPA